MPGQLKVDFTYAINEDIGFGANEKYWSTTVATQASHENLRRHRCVVTSEITVPIAFDVLLIQQQRNKFHGIGQKFVAVADVRYDVRQFHVWHKVNVHIAIVANYEEPICWFFRLQMASPPIRLR